MKKMIKNLMLVAVAAMAFVACSQDVNDINILPKQTALNFTARFVEDTRAYFGEKGEEGYPVYWAGGEEVTFVAPAADYDGTYSTTATAVKADEQGIEATFNVVFDNPIKAGTVYAYLGQGWNSMSNYAYVNENQTPTATSVDPNCIMASTSFEYNGETMEVSGDFAHGAGYGKMTINGFEGKTISSVELSFAGTNNCNYTLNVADIAEHTYWFASEENNVESFTITVVADGAYYSKNVEIDSDKHLYFKKGLVSKFSVSGLEPTGAVVAPDLSTADYIATDIAWNADSSRFDFTLDGTSRTFGVYLNSANTNARHSTILEGDYTVDARRTPAEGMFSVFQNVNGTSRPAGDTGVTSTMSVKYVNEQYYITIYYYFADSLSSEEFTVAYYGIPTNWLAPGEELAEPTKLATPVVTVDTVQGNQAALYWYDIDGAGSYTVTYNSETTTETTTVYTNQVILSLAWDTTYTVTVVANPAEEALNYASDASNPVIVEVGSDPNAGSGETPDTPDGYIEVSRCIYYGDLMGAGIRDEFVLTNSDRSTMVFFHTNNINSDSNRISSGEYTKGGLMATGYTFSFDSTSGSCKINGTNITSITDATMSVKSEGAGANHEIKMTIVANGTTYNLYFNGTIG